MASLPQRNTCFPVSDVMGIPELPRRIGNNLNDIHAIRCVTLGLFTFSVFGPGTLVFYICCGVYFNLVGRGSEHVGFSSNVCDLNPGGARFRPRPRDRISWLAFFVHFLIPTRKMLG